MSTVVWSTSFQASAFATLIVAAAIFGACVQQVARYIYVYRNDSISLKIWVFLVLSTTSVGIVLDSICTWRYLTGRASGQLIVVEGGLSGVPLFLVQIFFIVRLWNVHREVRPNTVVTIPIVTVLGLMSLASFACTMVDAILAANTGILNRLDPHSASHAAVNANLLKVKILIDAVLDALVTFFLSALLQSRRREISHLHRDSPIEQILVFFAIRGITMAVVQIIILILIFATNYITVATANITLMPKIYTISMLLTLNNRKAYRGHAGSGPSHTPSTDPVDLVLFSFQGDARARTPSAVERAMPRSGRVSPVVFASSKGPPAEVSMKPERGDFDKALGELRRNRSAKSSSPYPPSSHSK